LFRIERNLVNLASMRSVLVDSERIEAGATRDYLDAAAFEAALMQEQAREQVSKILEDAEAEAKEKMEKMIGDARNEVAALLLAAREEAEENRRRAWQEGFAEGSEEGKRSYDSQLEAKIREADALLEEKIRDDDEKLKRVIEELYEERTRTYSGLEEEVIDLAQDIVRKVVDPSEESGDVFNALIKNALKQMNPDGRIEIRVSNAEYERFFSAGSVVFELESGTKVTASMLRDASLNEGDCIIDASEETVNAGLESQLKYVKLAFEKCRL